ncbi:MAG: WhiB family transcriptional regulator [Mycobacterium sp.]|nr:WhiB family transcriptional regulator [Mycobacterium sp.]MBV9720457.1 WhiB family transcriptional regulator [Mycobacterium sp.]
MSDSPPPSRSLVCQRDPERWFDRHQRRDALAGCLVCPARRWCAREALDCNASWGMWAGVWIDGHRSDAAPYLKAIAAEDASPADHRPPIARDVISHDPPPRPLRRPAAAAPLRSASAAVLARSCGHCEVFTPGCRYSFDRVVNRCPSPSPIKNPSPAELFATCMLCAEMVAGLQPQLATRSGYLVAAGHDPASVPFFWRGSRWVLLARDGWLTEIGDDARSA